VIDRRDNEIKRQAKNAAAASIVPSIWQLLQLSFI
jgi:hypothetical protein